MVLTTPGDTHETEQTGTEQPDSSGNRYFGRRYIFPDTNPITV
jgi:hypothetical protein